MRQVRLPLLLAGLAAVLLVASCSSNSESGVPSSSPVPSPTAASLPTSTPEANPCPSLIREIANVQALALTPAEVATLEQACANIAKLRQGALTIELTDGNGRPLRGIPVRIEQKKHRFRFGGQPNELQRGVVSAQEQAAYEERFFSLFNEFAWGFVWRSYEATQGNRRNDVAEIGLRLAAKHGTTVRGHALIYTQEHPPWFTEIGAQAEQFRVAEAHVRDLATRYKGRVSEWVVVNETKNTFSLAGMLRGQQLIAPLTESTRQGVVDYVDPAFRWARESDPSAILLFNDNRVVSGKQLEKIEAILQELKRRNTPFDGIGIQTHMKNEGRVPLDRMQANLTQLAQYGRLNLTELSVPSRPSTPSENLFDSESWAGWSEETQAAYALAMYIIAFGHPAVDGITYWSFTDRRLDPNTTATGLLREDLSPRPIYEKLKRLIHEVWQTRWDGTTDSAGGLRLQAFLGDYTLIATMPDGRKVEMPFTVKNRDESVKLTVK